MGLGFSNNGHISLAQTNFEKALIIDPHNGWAHNGLSFVHLENADNLLSDNKINDAKKSYKLALEHNTKAKDFAPTSQEALAGFDKIRAFAESHPEIKTSTPPKPESDDSGCLIATAAYGTELAPQVQLLREIRDNTLFSTTSGTSFMLGFNTIYYSFAPTVADWERESPIFKETVKTLITPMLSTLSIMSLADEGSEVEVLGLGISVIALNLGMYIVAPAVSIWQIKKRVMN